MARYRNFEYFERQGSPRFGFAQDKTRVSRILDVDWDDFYVAARSILGHSELKWNEDGTAAYISRTTPMPISAIASRDQNRAYLYATAVNDITGIGYANWDAQDELAGYNLSRLEVEFSSLPYEVLEDSEVIGGNGTPDEGLLRRYVIKTVKPDAQYLSLPRGQMSFAGQNGDAGYRTFTPSDPRTFPEGVGKIVPCAEIRLRFLQIPKAAVKSRLINPDIPTPRNYLDEALGKVNVGTWNGFPYGTLLLLGFELSPTVSPFGDRQYDIELVFRHAPQKHNRIFWPANAKPIVTGGSVFSAEGGPIGWTRISTDGELYTEATWPADGKQIYDSYDYRLLTRYY